MSLILSCTRHSDSMIRLSNARYEEIKRIVVRTFEDYDVSCVPISGFEIAKKMGVKVIPYSAYVSERIRYLMCKESTDGFTVLRDDGWYIFYNDEHGYGRINHTLMHEVGHIVLDHTEDSELAEVEVRFFAKYALAPPVLIHKLRLSTAEDVANAFGISYEAARYALAYYKKWLDHSGRYYKDYELRLLRLFGAAV